VTRQPYLADYTDGPIPLPRSHSSTALTDVRTAREPCRRRVWPLHPDALCGKVLRVTDDTRQPTGDSHGVGAHPVEPRLAQQEFEQLALEATIIGPGMRTEDHYERGAKLKIKGQRGVFTYKYASVSQAGLVSLHLVGEGTCRAVRPEQVAPVRKARFRR
jgi:hypothetical protein